MATPGVHSRDEVIIRLNEGSGYQFYWQPSYLLAQFEHDLQQLFRQAGLRGTFEVKRVGRYIAGNGQEGIALEEPQPYVILFYAEYGDSSKKDVWESNFGIKDTTEIHNHLTRALAGEIILPPALLESVAKKEASEVTPPEESRAVASEATEEVSPNKARPQSRECDPLARAYLLTCLYSEASNAGLVRKSVLTDLAMDYYQFDDRRIPNFIHRNLVKNSVLKRSETTDRLYEIAPGAQTFAREHLEALLALPAFQAKITKLEELSKGSPYKAATRTAKRAQRRIKVFLGITE